MNKKKQASIDRKNRIRTRREQKKARETRERKGLMLDLNKLDEMAREQDAAEEAKNAS